MVSGNENFRHGVWQKIEGALEVIATSGKRSPASSGELKQLAQELQLDLSPGEEAMILDAINGTSSSPYSIPPKGVIDRYPVLAKRWRMYKTFAGA